MDVRNNLQAGATLVVNEFIDRYMADANGEYVKVYLYLLRHIEEGVEITAIADALNHTEADVKRALTYWTKVGVLRIPETEVSKGTSSAAGKEADRTVPAKPDYSSEDIVNLKSDDDFAQLLYIAQKYMNKIFTPKECEVFAYLYDGLHLSVEYLEYLVEYCVQSGHTSIRYIETVALEWHGRGLRTVQEAKQYSETFVKGSYAVMKAFGLNGRNPGESEKAMMEKWYHTYGFVREVVVEACNRTLESTHKPSFQYADKILSEWKKNGVKNLSDVRVLDQKRQASVPKPAARKPTNNQFHNFNQRDTDYDALILQGLKEQ